MSNERANDLLSKSTYLNFRKRERHTIAVRRLNDKAILTLFQLLGILDAKEGSLINLGLKFTKRGECRVRLGKNVIVSIPDAGSCKEFQRKLLSRWTNHDRYIWYSNEDKLAVLSDMEFDEELQPKRPAFEVDDTYVDLPEALVASVDPTKFIGTVGHSPYYGRGHSKSRARMLVAVAAAQMSDIDSNDDHAIETVDDSGQAVFVGNTDVKRTLALSIADKLNKDLERCVYDYRPHDCKPEDSDEELPW